jgi:hypothetical protein
MRLCQLSHPNNHSLLCENARRRFDEVVDFDAEFEKIKVFLHNLV